MIDFTHEVGEPEDRHPPLILRATQGSLAHMVRRFRSRWSILVCCAWMSVHCGGSDGMETGAEQGLAGEGGSSEALNPDVDWEAWNVVYSPMYSAYDGEHVYSLPVYIDGVATTPEDWQAIPSDAVSFAEWQSDDGSQQGVLVTVEQAAPEVTLAAHSGDLGGKTTLFVTEATPDQWEVGQDRYKNGANFDILALANNPEIFQSIEFVDGMATFGGTAKELGLDPSLRCDSCHTSGAENFQVQHTPTQAARFSDEELVRIFTMGMKPEGVEFRVLPPRFRSFYEFMHTWEVTPEQAEGLVVYLRSLTPEGQGDSTLPSELDSLVDPAMAQ